MKLRDLSDPLYRSGVKFQAGSRIFTPDACVKLHLTNAEVGMWNAEGWSRCALSFFKIDRIHHFDIRHSLFDIRFFRVFFPIRLGARVQRRRS